MTSINSNSFYIETYGCAANKADSAIMETALRNSGYHRTTFEEAKYVIINTCAVKQATENKLRSRLKDLHAYSIKHPSKKIIIAGCLPHISPDYIDIIKELIPTFSAILGLNSISKIPDIIRKIEEGAENIIFSSEKKIDKAHCLSDHSTNKLTAIIPISEGCYGACTYCCVKNARGALKCYEPHSIISSAEHYLKQGTKQLYLTSQDCSNYKFNSTSLADLIRDINAFPYDFFLRLGMINPSYLYEHLDQVIQILQFNKVYQFLHIPIQSGSNRILKKMNRPYKNSQTLGKIALLRKKFPYLTISTDIICGFPSESEYEFYKTINIIKWLQPEILNISQFTPRPNTKAKEMEQLSSEIIKDRSTRLSKVFRKSLNYLNEKWKGWEGKILVLHEGTEENQVFGRNFAYKNVFLKDPNVELGTFVNVEITKVEGFNLYAKQI